LHDLIILLQGEVWAHKTSFLLTGFYWSDGARLRRWTVMYTCVSGVYFTPFYDFDIWFVNCSDDVVLFVFPFHLYQSYSVCLLYEFIIFVNVWIYKYFLCLYVRCWVLCLDQLILLFFFLYRGIRIFAYQTKNRCNDLDKKWWLSILSTGGQSWSFIVW
jgi:hypothetical protein